MTENGSEARAARSAARAVPVTVNLGTAEFEFEPAMPLDVVMSLDTLNYETHLEGRVWVEAHIVTGAECDTSCADGGLPLMVRSCPSEDAHRSRLKKARNEDGTRVTADQFHAFHEEVLNRYAVDEGESSPSSDSPATDGAESSGIASGPAST